MTHKVVIHYDEDLKRYVWFDYNPDEHKDFAHLVVELSDWEYYYLKTIIPITFEVYQNFLRDKTRSTFKPPVKECVKMINLKCYRCSNYFRSYAVCKIHLNPYNCGENYIPISDYVRAR